MCGGQFVARHRTVTERVDLPLAADLARVAAFGITPERALAADRLAALGVDFFLDADFDFDWVIDGDM